MSEDVTRLLEAAAAGDRQAAADLLPLVYEELRKLAAARMVDERPGQTLEATALVHEAADILDIAPRTADRIWAYARAWLHREVQNFDASDQFFGGLLARRRIVYFFRKDSM